MTGRVWYNVHVCNEQCESGYRKIFVVLAQKKTFLYPDS